MSLSCLHTHTLFCDGRDDVERMCRRASEKGLDSLGFSAHAPITKKTGISSDWHLRDEKLGEYLDAVRSARERWQGRLRIYLGLEVDYIEGLMGPADRDYRELGLDYLIGSVHYLVPPGGEPFTVDGPPEEFARGIRLFYRGDGEAAMEAYWDALEAMIRAGGFDILGHADLIKKNIQRGPDRWFDREGPVYRGRISRIASLTAEGAKNGGAALVTEVNTGGLNRGRTAETYPSLPFLRLLAEKKAPVIITADAHRAEDLDGHYAEARDCLRRAGYGETLLFRGRINGRPQWEPEPLGAALPG